jgi:hypothetical protein
MVARVRKRFGINRIVFVGDRSMITTAQINEDLRGVEGLDWISALRTEGIRKLMAAGTIQMSLFDRQDLAEVSSDLFPDERWLVCRSQRPIYHSNEDRTGSHVFICMLAYYVQWHMREKLRGGLFAEGDQDASALSAARLRATRHRRRITQSTSAAPATVTETAHFISATFVKKLRKI